MPKHSQPAHSSATSCCLHLNSIPAVSTVSNNYFLFPAVIHSYTSQHSTQSRAWLSDNPILWSMHTTSGVMRSGTVAKPFGASGCPVSFSTLLSSRAICVFHLVGPLLCLVLHRKQMSCHITVLACPIQELCAHTVSWRYLLERGAK